MPTKSEYQTQHERCERNRKERDAREAANLAKILEGLPDDLQFDRIHASAYLLWGTLGVVTIKAEKRSDIRPAVEALPPIATSLIRDGSTSFRPDATRLDNDKDARAWERGSHHMVAPIIIRCEAVARQVDKVEWFARLDNGAYIRVVVELEGFGQVLGRFHTVREGKHGTGKYVLRDDFQPAFNAGGFSQIITWWTSREWAAPRTIWWADNESVASILDRFESEEN